MLKKYEQIVEFIRHIYQNKDGIIPLHAPVFRGNEKKYIEDCINTTFVSSVGKYVDLLEEKIKLYTGAKKAVACINGTSALHIALKLAGVNENTEVITQPLTFIATANAITYCNAQPVFLDVDIETMGLSPNKLLNFLETQTYYNKSTKKQYNKITNKVISACVPVHTFGHPCQIVEIVEICNHYNIPVVEDAAESLGSYYKGQHTGTFGKIGIISFNGNKIVTTGGGGMLLFQDELLAQQAKHITTQAKITHSWDYAHDKIGYNYRMPNINAALGLAQLEQLDKFLESKKNLALNYRNFFKPLNIKTAIEPPNSSSNYWLNAIFLNNRKQRDSILQYCIKNGIMIRPAWKLMNELPMYEKCQSSTLENAKNIENKLINLPSSVI